MLWWPQLAGKQQHKYHQYNLKQCRLYTNIQHWVIDTKIVLLGIKPYLYIYLYLIFRSVLNISSSKCETKVQPSTCTSEFFKLSALIITWLLLAEKKSLKIKIKNYCLQLLFLVQYLLIQLKQIKINFTLNLNVWFTALSEARTACNDF